MAAASSVQNVLSQCGAGAAAEPEIALSRASRRVPRLCEAEPSLAGPVRLHFDSRGAISNLKVVPQASFEAEPVTGEVELHVRAVGLNFRDVLNVLGVYPGDPGAPGSDSASNVVKLGPGIPHLREGGTAVGHAQAALASVARTDARLIAEIDMALTFEQACTLPTTWSTVHMFMLASRPRASDQLLLHAGAGGVGLAAGEYSHWLRARPSATVGRPYKHFYLHALGLKGRTLSSRDGVGIRHTRCESAKLVLIDEMELAHVSETHLAAAA